MSRVIVHHGNNKDCPSVQEKEGATHCPGHTVEVPEMSEAGIVKAYGRGFRRCFEMMRKTPALYVLLFEAGEYDHARALLRDKLFHQLGPAAVSGFDSIEK